MIENIQAEQSVIGSILVDGTLFNSSKLSEEHFSDYKHRRIFRAFGDVANKDQDINVVTVTTALGDSINQVGGVGHLTKLAGSIPSTESIRHYEQLVIESYRDRKSQEVALKYAEQPTEETLNKLVSQLEQLQEVGAAGDEKSTYDYLMEIADLMMTPPTETQKGNPTGFTDFDNMTGGTQDSDLVIIAARPSVGKTAFALNVGAGHCQNGGTTHIFSLEMGTMQLLQRMISSEASLDGQKWRSMKFSETDYNNGMDAIEIISDWGLYIHENTQTINEIKSQIRKSVNEAPEEKHFVIIDYLQLIRATGRYERRDLEVGAITRELKLLAKELNIPIVLLSQLSRSVEQRQDKRPMLSDLRESGNIEQDADVVGFLYRDDYYDQQTEKQNIIEIILSKQRNGPVGSVELLFRKEYGRFLNLNRRYRDEQT